MKKIILFIVLALIFCLATITASAETLTFSFDFADSVNWVTSRGTQCKVEFDNEAGYLKLTSTGSDPHVYHSFEKSPVSTDNYKYVYYRFKVIEGLTEDMPQGQFFFGTDEKNLGDTGTHTSFEMSNSDKWQSVSYNLSELSGWSGNMTSFRLDHVQSSASTFSVLVHSITFCSTEEEIKELNKLYFADVTPPNWIFTSYNDWIPIIDNSSHLDYEVADGYLTFYPIGSDPYVYFEYSDAEAFSGDKNKWVAFRMKNVSKGGIGTIFFSTDDVALSGETASNFQIINDGQWHDYCIDMSKFGHDLWSGRITSIRMDVINFKDLNAEITFDRFGVFATEEEAREFLAKEVVSEVDAPFDDYINSGAAVPCWDFRTTDNIGGIWVDGGGNHIYKNGLYMFNAVSYESWITNHLAEEEFFDGEEFYVFGIRMKNMSDVAFGALFFTNDSNVSSFNDSAYVRVEHGPKGEWTDFIYNIRKNFIDKWKGKITSFRFDIINSGPSEFVPHSGVYVSRMGFFRSEEEAREYLNGGNETPDFSLPTSLKGDFQSIVIPGGVLEAGYSEDDYKLSSVNISGEGKYPLVLFTDEKGTFPVALSDVNSAGYSRYVAARVGDYTLGYNDRNFVDTASHWADKYIGYVSSRGVFNGTSETEFSPDMPMTRGMFATVMGRMHGIDVDSIIYDCTYSDVNEDLYYAPYVKWVTDKDIMSEVSSGKFAPERAVTRFEMVEAIYNYAKAYAYEFSFYNDVDEFDDIAYLGDDAAEKIAALQRWGIINGKSSAEFDPLGISTRAEVSAVIQRTIKSVTGAVTVEGTLSNEEITKKRIRLGVWSFQFNEPEEVKRLDDLGVNLICTGAGTSSERVWNLCDKYGIEVFMQDYPFGKKYAENPADPNVFAAEYMDHPSFGGHFFTDEPGTDDFGWIGTLIDHYNSVFPDKTAFVNLLPMYANAAQLKFGAGAAAIEYYDPDPELYRKYCQEWFATNDADYICTDIYPLNWKNGKKTTYDNYAESINQIATVARENDAEFWCCIQTYGWASNKRTPDESEFRWQCYSMLSYGCTGILLWSYTGSTAFPSMIDMRTRELRDSYYACRNVFNEMNFISDTYIEYKNLGAFTHNYSDDVPYLYMSGEYDIDSTVFTEISCSSPLLFGYFEKILGDGNAFTVVNMEEFEDGNSTTVKFKLKDSSKTVTSYHRGIETVLVPTNGYYTINLEVGDGAFVTVTQ